MYRTNQNGMTMWGMAVVLALIVFFTLLGLSLLPPYLDNFKVQTSLKNVAKQLDGGSMTPEEVTEALRKRFEIENLDSTIDLRKALKIEARGRNKKAIRIAYEVRVPLAYNLSALIEFNNIAEVKSVE